MEDMELLTPILLTGATGLVGTALKNLCAQRGIPCWPCSHSDFDITDAAATEAVLAEFATTVKLSEPLSRRGLVINAAAYTDVDRAEDERERAFAVNAQGAANVAAAAARHGLDLIHLSTDYVFDGEKGAPYVETDEPRPLNVYGRSKLAGEQAVAAAHPEALIVRTSWLYGPGRTTFADKIAAKVYEAAAGCGRGQVTVVADQHSSPTSASDLAWGLIELHQRGARGLYHLAGSGSCSRYELATEVVAALGAVGAALTLVPVAHDALPTKAIRPSYSVLDCDKVRRLGVELSPWRECLRAFVRQYLAETIL